MDTGQNLKTRSPHEPLFSFSEVHHPSSSCRSRSLKQRQSSMSSQKDSQCFMWSILAALYPNTSNPNETSSYVPHLNKLNFDGISFPTPLNEVTNFQKMNDIE
ncbi:hypothetical protein TNCV_3579571 [Trichonephila clavipes]|nr:hypothetical protein TNCV_3579571 [Trichonephila clavipes]